MARREINIFVTSFLDLLSGALGAVIILFIIVPKIVPDVYTVYEIPSVSVSKQKNTWFVTFRLTDNGFEILPLRKPIWVVGKVIK